MRIFLISAAILAATTAHAATDYSRDFLGEPGALGEHQLSLTREWVGTDSGPTDTERNSGARGRPLLNSGAFSAYGSGESANYGTLARSAWEGGATISTNRVGNSTAGVLFGVHVRSLSTDGQGSRLQEGAVFAVPIFISDVGYNPGITWSLTPSVHAGHSGDANGSPLADSWLAGAALTNRVSAEMFLGSIGIFNQFGDTFDLRQDAERNQQAMTINGVDVAVPIGYFRLRGEIGNEYSFHHADSRSVWFFGAGATYRMNGITEGNRFVFPDKSFLPHEVSLKAQYRTGQNDYSATQVTAFIAYLF